MPTRTTTPAAELAAKLMANDPEWMTGETQRSGKTSTSK